MTVHPTHRPYGNDWGSLSKTGFGHFQHVITALVVVRVAI